MADVTLTLRDTPEGGVVVHTTFKPALGQRLSPAQTLAMRTLLRERAGVLADLRGAGIDVLSWDQGDPDAALRIAAGRARRNRGRRARR